MLKHLALFFISMGYLCSALGCSSNSSGKLADTAQPLADIYSDTGAPGDTQDTQGEISDSHSNDTPEEIAADIPAPPPEHPVCQELGLKTRELIETSEESSALRATAADFTVATLEGIWNLRENWTGCDTYLFLLDKPNSIQGSYGYKHWEFQKDINTLLTTSPKNVHWFFISTATIQAERDTVITTMQQRLQGALNTLPPEEQEWWQSRLHYVTDQATNLDGWLGDIMLSPAWGAAIDRFQKIRYIGSYADPNHYVPSQDWPFGPNISMTANEAIYFNYEAQRQDILMAKNATIVELWHDNPLAASPGPHITTVDLPDANTMAGFDTLELDLTLHCQGPGELGYCPAWDYNVYLYLCNLDSPDECDQEIGHWITPYHREGRWVHDVSSILPLLSSGGQRSFQIAIDDPWEVTLRLRLSSQDKPLKPSQSLSLFAGEYTLDEQYNSHYPPLTLAIPADAQKVEIASVITGHGMAQPGNCNEFCNTDHHFGVNGTDNVRDFPITITDSTYGCMHQIDVGTVPNQYGTWWFGRGGWCPGKQVDMVLQDITAQVMLGADNTFTYEGFQNGNNYAGDNWNYIRLASWVVISR